MSTPPPPPLTIYVLTSCQSSIPSSFNLRIAKEVRERMCMHGWMDTSMDGYMDGYIDGWVCVCTENGQTISNYIKLYIKDRQLKYKDNTLRQLCPLRPSQSLYSITITITIHSTHNHHHHHSTHNHHHHHSTHNHHHSPTHTTTQPPPLQPSLLSQIPSLHQHTMHGMYQYVLITQNKDQVSKSLTRENQ